MPKPSTIRLFLDQLTVDPTQYKPYSHILRPAGAVLIELPVDPDDVVEYSEEDDVLVLDLDGFKALLTIVADTVEDAHEDRREARAIARTENASKPTRIIRNR